MNHHAIEALYNERVKDIEKAINAKSGGDEDLRQEGLWGAYLALQRDPNANKTFLLNKSGWEMVGSTRRGRSLDNGFYKRKNLEVIRYNQLPADDKVFSSFIREYGQEPVDEQVIFRISLQRMFNGLSDNETRYIRHKTMDGMSDVSIKKALRITFKQIREIKRNIRRQIELAFAA
ncbi:MAG: hypothetical protein CVU57_02415 [Deltaproteobacteria bacterium HGW-Deltaproteobacteria-15]|jgi:hypothetical protein|nr:MAG: hypothetical protein CVU57_02415 [Deltaproteobacteria bacterium HGW-Deltaproteobacteria-15]